MSEKNNDFPNKGSDDFKGIQPLEMADQKTACDVSQTDHSKDNDVLKEDTKTANRKNLKVDKKQKKKQVDAFKNVSTSLAVQKKSKIAILRALGEWFYTLGFTLEYRAILLWRILKDAFLFFAQIFGWIGGIIAKWLSNSWHILRQDIKIPFRRIRKRREQLQRVRRRIEQRGSKGKSHVLLRKIGMQDSFWFLLQILKILAPIAASVALIVTVYSIVNMRYALAVAVDGKVLGYVEDQNVVEDAKSLLRDRMQLAEGQEFEDWNFQPEYEIAWTDELTTSAQLVNAILQNSEESTDLVEATGVYVGGDLYAVTTEGNKLQSYLDEILQTQALEYDSDVEIEFVQDVMCDVESEDVFLASSVQSYDELVAQLSQNVTDAVTVVADGVQTLADIALQNGLPSYLVVSRNPELEQEAMAEEITPDAYVPQAGRSVVIQNAATMLQVQTKQLMQNVEYLSYDVIEQENPDKPIGTRTVVQEGIQGVMEVWDDFIMIDGELIGRERVEELTTILSQPVPQIVEVGTKDYASLSLSGDPEGYVWPAPTSTWSSRGISSYHRGIDINAPIGEPLYAVQSGTVVSAGYHYSWGYNVLIDHHNGIMTRYAHCSSMAVEAGQQVEKGEYIAAVGNTGNSSGPHLHLEFILADGSVVDPLLYVVPPEGYNMPWA